MNDHTNNETALELIMQIMAINDMNKITANCQQLQELSVFPFEDDGFPCDDDDDETHSDPYWVQFIDRLLTLHSNHGSNPAVVDCILQLLIHLFLFNKWELNLRWNKNNEMNKLIKILTASIANDDLDIDIRTNCIQIMCKLIAFDGDKDQRYYVLRHSDLLSTFNKLCDSHTNETILNSIANCVYNIVSIVVNQYFAQSVAPIHDIHGFDLVQSILLILNKLLLQNVVHETTDMLHMILMSYCEIFRQFKHHPIKYSPHLLNASISDAQLQRSITDVNNCVDNDLIETFLNGKSRESKLYFINKARQRLAKEVVNQHVKIGCLVKHTKDKIDVSVYRNMLIKKMSDAMKDIPDSLCAIILSYSLDSSPYVIIMHLMDHDLYDISAYAVAVMCSLIDCNEDNNNKMGIDINNLFDCGLNYVLKDIVNEMECVPLEIAYLCVESSKISKTSTAMQLVKICASKLNTRKTLQIWDNISFGSPRDIDNVVFS